MSDMSTPPQGLLGIPCWYELMTPDPDAAQAFYSGVLPWQMVDSGMPGIDYRLARVGEAMVAGLMAPPAPDVPCFWMIYFATPDIAATVKQAEAAGGRVHRAPEDIPGVGRFAIVGDPQGTGFALLQPNPGGQGGAFDQRRTGHCHWNELRTTAPEAALAFYGTLFGWTESRRMDMGPMGFYHILSRDGAEIGAVFRGPDGAPPAWLPYFGIDSVGAAMSRLAKAGGTVTNGPMEVPGGAFTIQAKDPQGIAFALVGQE